MRKASLINVAFVKFILKKKVKKKRKKKMYPRICTNSENIVNTTINVLNDIDKFEVVIYGYKVKISENENIDIDCS